MSVTSVKARKLGLVLHTCSEGVRYSPPCGLVRVVAVRGVAIDPTEQIHYGRLTNDEAQRSCGQTADFDLWDQRHR